ncbi:MAG: ribosome biogenesis/translation initiation ATPase RLI [Candidatus Aenigmatarchaeota archaeon]
MSKKRIAVVDRELCKPNECASQCIKVCPINRTGKKCIELAEYKIGSEIHQRANIDEELCIGCGLCVKKCPFKAISVVNLPQALDEEPIHRFGENEFALYRIPIPSKGVVGLLGPNGVGKTTALKILSGEIKPNLGSLEGVDWNKIITIFRGTELQSYLERLSKSVVRAVIKPQNVSLIPQIEKGLVKDLLKNVPKELIEKLGIEKILERNVKDISGGEAQKIAVAAALAKDADVYYFDEPSSFLDVKERLNVASLIRKKSESSSVMVVEHDLATLDFLADNVHIFYGEPGVYGIVSRMHTVRNGINVFLDGYIAEDNVRIREPTKFETVIRGEASVKPLIEFSNTIKSFKDAKSKSGFELVVDSGIIYKNEVLGIFGSNALGKTTFMKILAGEITDFDGSINKKIKIAYKPQYISADFNGTVYQMLATVKNVFSAENKISVLEPLQLEKLFDKNVSELSGGELQRLAIALTLSKDAELYLLDEPSAFLDVDQRLIVAKVLRGFAERGYGVVVIDHDLLFLSYASNRAMLFSGVGSVNGHAKLMPLKDAMNAFLKECNITFRRDPASGRPRANKPGSQKDTAQKREGNYFF